MANKSLNLFDKLASRMNMSPQEEERFLMKCKFNFLSDVDDILVVYECIQIIFLIFTLISLKCLFSKGHTDQFFLRNSSLWTVQFSLINLQGHGFNIIIQSYVSKEWGHIYQHSLKKRQQKAIQLP